LDEKEYGLEVGWKRRYIERRSSLNEQNMDKKLDEKIEKIWIKKLDKKIEKIWRSAIRPLVQVYYRL
jgi:hypothetical protein